MKITPLEIRQKTFEKNLRGYDKDEVHAFLATMSQEWEKMLDELKENRMRLDAAEREVSRLREVESTLFKTLKTAEDTGNNLVEQATKAAELQLREAQLQSDGMLYEARTKAKEIIEEAETRSQQVLDDLETKMKEVMQEYRGLMIQKDNLAADLMRMASELHDRAEKVKKLNEGFDPDQHLSKVKKEIFSPSDKQTSAPEPKPNLQPKSENIIEKNSGSFFDQIQ